MANWRMRIELVDVWQSKTLTFEEKRDEIVRRVRASGWATAPWASPTYIESCLRDLARCTNVKWFDRIWNDVRSEADIDRVWLATSF